MWQLCVINDPTLLCPGSGYGVEKAVGEVTLKKLSNGEGWDAEILFRCIWGNTKWLNKLADSLGMVIHEPPFKPIIDDMASKINNIRQHQSHCEAHEMLDASSLCYCRQTVIQLLQVLIGNEGAIVAK